MKRYITIKNFRNINPVIVNKDSENKECELKYGRLYLNGDLEQGALISIIGANGSGKTNILKAIEKTFKGGIEAKKDNPKIEGFISCKAELNIFIETDIGLKYKGHAENGSIVWELLKENTNNIVFDKNYLTRLINHIFQNNSNYKNNYLQQEETIYPIYEYNYRNSNNTKEEYTNEDILDYTAASILDIISKYDNNTDKLKLLTSLLNTQYYKLNQTSKHYDFVFNENTINNNDIEKIENILKEIDCINNNVYVHNKNIENEELIIQCYRNYQDCYQFKAKNILDNSDFLYSLFKSTNNMEMYNYLLNNYNDILSDVAFTKQIENEINKLLETTISKKFNELYKSNNEYTFKISLDEYFIKIYFETKNGLTNLENESEGFNWFFSLFFNTINNNELKKGDIIIIDEPEQHLSVPLIKDLRNFLKRFAKDNGVTIITSIQIPYFADINYLDELKIVERKQDSIGVKIENDFSATYGKVDTLEKIVNAFGVKHIDITRDTKIIYVEGITDYNYFTAFKILMEHIENKESNIAFMPINGVGRPNDEKRKKNIIDSLCQLSAHPILLIDGDDSADQFRKLAENTNLKITQIKDIDSDFITIEDLFDDEDKQKYKIDKNNKDALSSGLLKNNIIEYYEQNLISQKSINNFFKVIKEID